MDAARAIDALRRGWTIVIEGADGRLAVRALETLYGTGAVSGGGLLLSASRAATLKLINQRAAADIELPVLIALPQELDGRGPDAAALHAIADPALDMEFPMKGPFLALPLAAADAAMGAMELARRAGLLPAFLVVEEKDVAQSVSTADIAAYADADRLVIAARARLPVSLAEQAEIVAFRSAADATEHVALIVGQRDESVPLVRIHSECLTGDVFGSLKCDCGPQLHEAVGQMTHSHWGVLLYLRQEGRGIGLINKLRAYMLQDQGFDTVDANVRLGFAVDARDFSTAAAMLHLLHIDAVRLLTNNPDKVAGLQAEGVTVRERVSLKIGANPHNERYLATKRDRTGHQL